MAQRPLDSFGFGASLSVGSPPPTSQRTTPTPGPSGSHTPANQASRKRTSVPPADTAARNPSFGVALADSDRQLILQLSLQVERMEKAILSSQATSTNRIRELEKQVASIIAELHRTRQQQNATPAPNKPTGTNPERGRSSARAPTQRARIPAAPRPHKPNTDDLTWAAHIAAAAEHNEKPFTTVARKQKKPAPPTLIPKPLPRTNREVIITCENIITEAERQKWANYALNRFNYAIRTTAEIDQPPLILARINSNNKLVLMTNPTTPATAYIPYMAILLNEIKSLKPTIGHMNCRWTKFLVHNVPTDTTPEKIRLQIASTYPELRLAQEPRWLVPTECRLNKTSSTIVISLEGAIDLKRLGTSRLAIHNRICRVTEYFSWTPNSHCRNCQGYGHHTKLCKAEKPTCAVCAQQHSTKDHLCPIPTCRAGKSCTHPPLKCAACGAAHKTTNPLCPVRIKHLATRRNKAPAPEQDEPMEQPR
jgi:hypothetical protein